MWSPSSKGIVRVILNDDFENKTLLKYGIRTYENQMNPNYPMMAWDPKGTRIAVLYMPRKAGSNCSFTTWLPVSSNITLTSPTSSTRCRT